MSLMKKLTSGIVVSSLVLGMVSTVFAGYTPETATASAERMVALKIVNGTENGLELDAAVTRAQFVTILVRAFGQEENAKMLAGADTGFTDITASDAWATGYIALAKNMAEKNGFKLGMDAEGTLFAPKANLTAAEAVAFLMKFMGIKAKDALGWPLNYIQGAVDAGLITADDKVALASQGNAPATRGLAFYLADQAFYSHKMPNGKTVYTTYLDPNAPLLTLNTVAPTTVAKSVKISGIVSGQSALYVGSTSNKVTPAADGKFEATVDLKVGQNDIWVQATDLAGNVFTQTVKVTRNAGAAASIEAAAITVAAGASVDFKAVVKDANGDVLTGAALEVKAGTLGSYANGRFTASTTVGAGTITLKSGAAAATVKVTVTPGAMAKIEPSKASVAPGEQVTLTAKDAYGNAITGAAFTQTSTSAALDANTGLFVASKSGSYAVTATKDGVSVTASIGVFGEGAKLAINAAATMTANVSTDQDGEYAQGTLYDVTVSLLDKNGTLVYGNNVDAVTFTPLGGLVVLDKDGNLVQDVSLVHGVATFKIGLEKGYDGNLLTAHFNVIDTAIEGEVEIAGAERVATTVSISGASKYVSSIGGDVDTMSVRVMDQGGVWMSDVSYNATVKVSGPAYVTAVGTKEDSVSFSLGEGAFTLVPEYGATGDITITATIDGIGTATKVASASVPGEARGVRMTITNKDGVAVTNGTADNSSKYTVTAQVVDAKGVPSTESAPDSLTVSFNNIDLSSLTITQLDEDGFPVDMEEGSLLLLDSTGSGSFTVKAGAFTSTLPIRLSAAGLTTASGSLAFGAASANKVGLNVYNSNLVAPGAEAVRFFVPVTDPTFDVSAQVYDTAGNKVAKSGVKVTFTAYAADYNDTLTTANATKDVSFNGTVKTFEAETDAKGAATVKVAARTITDKDYTIEVTTGDLTPFVGRTKVSFQVKGTVVKTATVSVKSSDTGNNVGTITNPETDTVHIYTTLTDNYDRPVNNAQGYLRLKLASAILWNQAGLGDKWTATEITSTEADALGYAWYESAATPGTYFIGSNANTPADITIAKAGIHAITVEYHGATTAVAGSRNISVKAAPLAKMMVVDKYGSVYNSGATLRVKGRAVSGPFTLKLVDRFGNVITTTAATGITVTDTTSDPQLANQSIGIRVAADAPTTTSLSTRSTQNFYVTTTLKSPTVSDTYKLTFDAGPVELVLKVIAD